MNLETSPAQTSCTRYTRSTIWVWFIGISFASNFLLTSSCCLPYPDYNLTVELHHPASLQMVMSIIQCNQKYFWLIRLPKYFPPCKSYVYYSFWWSRCHVMPDHITVSYAANPCIIYIANNHSIILHAIRGWYLFLALQSQSTFYSWNSMK